MHTADELPLGGESCFQEMRATEPTNQIEPVIELFRIAKLEHGFGRQVLVCPKRSSIRSDTSACNVDWHLAAKSFGTAIRLCFTFDTTANNFTAWTCTPSQTPQPTLVHRALRTACNVPEKLPNKPSSLAVYPISLMIDQI